jgi:hypothetical protein
VENSAAFAVQCRVNLYLLIGGQMVRYLTINFFMAIIVFASAGLALQSIRASHDTAHWNEIATQVGLNTIQLKSLQGELDQLERQECFVSKSLGACYDYIDMCSTWEMR